MVPASARGRKDRSFKHWLGRTWRDAMSVRQAKINGLACFFWWKRSLFGGSRWLLQVVDRLMLQGERERTVGIEGGGEDSSTKKSEVTLEVVGTVPACVAWVAVGMWMGRG